MDSKSRAKGATTSRQPGPERGLPRGAMKEGERSPDWFARVIEAEVARAIPSLVRAHAAVESARQIVGRPSDPEPSPEANREPNRELSPAPDREPNPGPSEPANQAAPTAGADVASAPRRGGRAGAGRGGGQGAGPGSPPGDEPPAPSSAEIIAAAKYALEGNLVALRDLVTRLRARAVPMSAICLDLIGGAARHIGYLWDEDDVNFVEVTFASGSFEAVLRDLLPALESELSPRGEGCAETGRILLASLPTETHRIGLTMVGAFFRGAGWMVHEGLGLSIEQLEQLVAVEWFDVIGMSASCDRHLDLLSLTLSRLRKSSCNPAVGCLVGGAQFVLRPHLVELVAADATAVDANEALKQAEQLRLRSRAHSVGSSP